MRGIPFILASAIVVAGLTDRHGRGTGRDGSDKTGRVSL